MGALWATILGATTVQGDLKNTTEKRNKKEYVKKELKKTTKAIQFILKN